MKNIILIGMMGCGKTTVSKVLGKKLHRTVVDVDKYIEEKYKQTIPELFENGENYFRDLETRCIEEISSRSDLVISTGGGVVLKSINIELLKKNGIIIYIDRPIELIYKDIDITNRPLLKDGPEALYEIYNKRNSLYISAAHYHLISDGSINQITKRIINVINSESEVV